MPFKQWHFHPCKCALSRHVDWSAGFSPPPFAHQQAEPCNEAFTTGVISEVSRMPIATVESLGGMPQILHRTGDASLQMLPHQQVCILPPI